MASIKKRSKAAKSAVKDIQKIIILIPAELHRKAQIHRIETGENMTRLIVRLLSEELG